MEASDIERIKHEQRRKLEHEARLQSALFEAATAWASYYKGTDDPGIVMDDYDSMVSDVRDRVLETLMEPECPTCGGAHTPFCGGRR